MKQLFRTLLIVAMLLALTACAPTGTGDAQSESTSTDATTETPVGESSDLPKESSGTPEESSGTPEEPNDPDVQDKITFKTLQQNDGTDVYGEVSNETTSFSFIDEIEVSGKATYVVCLDLYGLETALTKIVPLESGDNVFYVLEQVGENTKLYTVTIRRLPLYTVSFDTNCDEKVAPQTVEEGALVTLPALSKSGYAFAGWYDGDKLVSEAAVGSFAPEKSLTLTAHWTPVDHSLEHFIYTFTEDTCTIVGVKDKTATSYEIPAAVTHIGEAAFRDCKNLKTLTIPESVSDIGFGAFQNCTSLSSITLPFVGKTKNEFFENTHLGYIFGAPSDEENETFVPASLRTVTVAGGTSIKSSAFKNCTSLTEIVLPESLTSIGSSAFKNCASLVSVTIPDSVTSIEYATFEGCVSLTSFTLPENVKKIDSCAFEDCKRLVEVYDLSPHITITAGSYENGQVANHALVVHTEKDAESRLWTDASGYQFYEDRSTRQLVRYTGSRTALTLPETCNGKNYEIHRYAFGDCDFLTRITIPESVTDIGIEAFYGCTSLTSITVPESVTGIGYSAFGACTSLTSITIPFVGETKNGTTYNKNFGYIFGATSYLDHPYLPASLHSVTITGGTSITYDAFNSCKSLTSIILSEGITNIGNNAFENCSALTSIVIPKSVENISFDAFTECTALTNVYYGGSASDWSNIDISLFNDALTSATRYYYCETAPLTAGNYWHYVNGVPTKW